MLNLLGVESNQIGGIILMVVLVVLLIGYIFFGMRSRKKNQEKAMQMLNELKAGDKIVTNAGVYGEIVSIKETNMGKVVTIKTGDEETKKTSYLTINASVILGIDEKKDLILDKDGNVIDDDDTTKKEELKKEVLKESAKPVEEKAESETKKEETKEETDAEENEIINKIKTKNKTTKSK